MSFIVFDNKKKHLLSEVCFFYLIIAIFAILSIFRIFIQEKKTFIDNFNFLSDQTKIPEESFEISKRIKNDLFFSKIFNLCSSIMIFFIVCMIIAYYVFEFRAVK
ncbi:MAG: hypothetical protein J6Y70_01190 [Bacilli bacterium]|nr:hypothetical protein [Bacilli bacterium]